MKRLVAFCLLVGVNLAASPVYAEGVDAQLSKKTQEAMMAEIEMGTYAAEDLMALHSYDHRYDRDRDGYRDYDRCRRYGDCRPGYPDRRPGRPGRPGYPDTYVCFAENARGDIFRGRDYDARWAQREAMDRCYAISYRCRALGCR